MDAGDIERLKVENEELRERVRQLEGRVDLIRLPSLGLTPMENRILTVLYMHGEIERHRLFSMLYGGDPNGGPSSVNILSVYMTKLRRKVAKHGIVIRTLKWSGYALTPESKKLIEALRWQEPGKQPQIRPSWKLASTL